MKRTRRGLTYANVVSTLCLFLLLGGGAAYAAIHLPKNSVGAKQIKKGAVTPAKLATAAKRTLRGKRGPAGPSGPAGPAGPQGVPGAAGATNVVVRVGAQEIGSEVMCKSGEVAVGGGGVTANEEQLLYGSIPVDASGEASKEGEKPVGWFAGGEKADGTPVETTAYVICASP